MTTFNLESNFSNIKGTGYKSGVHGNVVDLFPGSSLDTNIWTVNNPDDITATVSSGVLNLATDGGTTHWGAGVISGQYSKVTGQSFYFRVRVPTGTAVGPNIVLTSVTNPSFSNSMGTGVYFRTSDNKLYLREDDEFDVGGTYSWSLDTWYDIEIKVLASTIEVYVDGNLIGTRTISYSTFYIYMAPQGTSTDELDCYWVKDSEVDSEVLINDASALLQDAGSGKAWDNSTAADTDTGSPTIKYQYADYAADQTWATAALVEANASWNGSWLTLAQLQAVSDTGLRYRYLKAQITPSAVTDTYDSYSCDDYTVDVTPPGVPTLTKSKSIGNNNYTMIWTEPVDADFANCELRRSIDESNLYLGNVDGIPTWQSAPTAYFTFADGDISAGWLQSNYTDEVVVGTNINYYVRSVDLTGNKSAWVMFVLESGGGGPVRAIIPTDKRLVLP